MRNLQHTICIKAIVTILLSTFVFFNSLSFDTYASDSTADKLTLEAKIASLEQIEFFGNITINAHITVFGLIGANNGSSAIFPATKFTYLISQHNFSTLVNNSTIYMSGSCVNGTLRASWEHNPEYPFYEYGIFAEPNHFNISKESKICMDEENSIIIKHFKAKLISERCFSVSSKRHVATNIFTQDEKESITKIALQIVKKYYNSSRGQVLTELNAIIMASRENVDSFLYEDIDNDGRLDIIVATSMRIDEDRFSNSALFFVYGDGKTKIIDTKSGRVKLCGALDINNDNFNDIFTYEIPGYYSFCSVYSGRPEDYQRILTDCDTP